MEISVLKNVLEANDLVAEDNRRTFDRYGCFAVNLMSSPGSGKTAILERTLAALDGRQRCAVIEGDVQGTLDAERLLPYGAPVVQVMKNEKGKYLVVVEGSIPVKDDGIYCTIGGRTALDIAREVCGNAAATITVGAAPSTAAGPRRGRIPRAPWVCRKRCRESPS